MLAVPPRWLAPAGERSALPLVLEPWALARGHRVLLAGLEPGATVTHAIEMFEGTWLIEAGDLARARLERGPRAVAETTLAIELRTVGGVLLARSPMTMSLMVPAP